MSAQIDVANVQLAATKPYQAMQVQRQAMTLTAAQILNARVIMSNILEEVSLLVPSGVSLQGMTVTVPPYMTPARPTRRGRRLDDARHRPLA